MKHLAFVPVLLLIIFASCNKTEKAGPVRIDTESNYYETALSDVSRYFYDEEGNIKLISYVSSEDGSFTVDTIIYSDDQIVELSYYNGHDTPYIYTNFLDSKGRVDSVTYSYDNLVYSSGKYNYDTNGYLIRENMYSKESGLEYFFTADYTVEKQNRVMAVFYRKYVLNAPETASFSVLSRRMRQPAFVSAIKHDQVELNLRDSYLKTARKKANNYITEYKDTAYFEYADTVNNISSYNRGVFWEGSQNKNLVRKQVRRVGGKDYVYNYSYTFDQNSRVTRMILTGNAEYKTKFTYKDSLNIE